MAKRGLVLLIALGLGLAACGGGGSSSASSFCDRVKNDGKDFNPSSAASGLAELKKIQSEAPSEIKGDLKTLVDYISSADSSHPKVPSASEIAKLTQASDNLTKYAQDKCHVNLSGGS
jgi:hypothetical protein